MENTKTLLSFLEEKNYQKLRELLIETPPADIAILFDDLPSGTLPLLFRLLPKEQAAEVFVELSSDMQELLIDGFSDTELKDVLDELYLDDTVDIIEEMPANVVKRIIRHSDPEVRAGINDILKYPKDSARQYHDHRICGFEKGYDRKRRVYTYPPHRRGQGNDLYLLCDRS